MKRSLGVIGGMGPLAAVDFLRKIVTLTDAASDAEHIRVYFDNNVTVPDRSAALSGGPSPVPAIVESIGKLERAGADCLVMTCNTAHMYLPELKKHTALPFVDIITAAAEACAAQYKGGTACILATQVLVNTGLYDEALERCGVFCMHPSAEDQAEIMALIYRVKAGFCGQAELSRMAALLSRLSAAGADCFILGCTELPVLAELLGVSHGIIDATTALAKAAIRFCGYKVREV